VIRRVGRAIRRSAALFCISAYQPRGASPGPTSRRPPRTTCASVGDRCAHACVRPGEASVSTPCTETVQPRPFRSFDPQPARGSFPSNCGGARSLVASHGALGAPGALAVGQCGGSHTVVCLRPHRQVVGNAAHGCEYPRRRSGALWIPPLWSAAQPPSTARRDDAGTRRFVRDRPRADPQHLSRRVRMGARGARLPSVGTQRTPLSSRTIPVFVPPTTELVRRQVDGVPPSRSSVLCERVALVLTTGRGDFRRMRAMAARLRSGRCRSSRAPGRRPAP
jgi:hypothetical protein